MMVYKNVSSIYGLNVGREILLHGRLDVILIEGSFAVEFSLYASLESPWSQGDIDCLGWDVVEANIRIWS